VNGNGPNLLNTWKEIALYLDCGVRTGQRWEAQLGLPVRRSHGKSRNHVLAFRSEIDEWLKSNFSPRRFNNPRHLALDNVERKISRHARRHPEISELVLHIQALRRNIMELNKALSDAEAQLEIAIYRLECKVENSPQVEIASITRMNPDPSPRISIGE
jgi:hypothetical protein